MNVGSSLVDWADSSRVSWFASSDIGSLEGLGRFLIVELRFQEGVWHGFDEVFLRTVFV